MKYVVIMKSSSSKFTHLFEPVNIGSVKMKNRIVMAPMITNLAGSNGEVTTQQIDYYVERARGGVGLIDVAWACVERWPSKKIGCLYVDNDEYIRGLEKLTSAVHQEGAKIVLQLSHPGRQISAEEISSNFAVSASDVSCFIDGKTIDARALTELEIEGLVYSFSLAALRAKRAGFDAVELHGASGYLIAQFLSPFTNKRTDSYGGNFSGRMKFPLQIIKTTRDLVGEDFPLLFRISGDELIEGGLRIEDNIEIAKGLEKAGVDAIHVTAGLLETYNLAMPPMSVPRGCFIPLAEKVKESVSIPVIGVGRINDPSFAEELLENKRVDLIAMGRSFLSDPTILKKTAEGKTNEIRRCIACNRCVMRIAQKLYIRCAINAVAGQEGRIRIEQSKDPRHILVIGGGPAGMEAARVASMRGHDVTLFERNEKLGGQLLLSTKPPHKDELKNELEYLSNQLEMLDVEVITKQEFTTDMIGEYSSETVIVATGAKPCIPPIPGLKQSHAITAWDVLAEKERVGKRVVIIGGGIVGCETAEFLSKKCEDITIIEALPQLALDSEPSTRTALLDRLVTVGINVILKSPVIELDSNTVYFLDDEDNRQNLETDSVILATGALSEQELVHNLKGKVANVYSVGDCVAPRLLMDAIHEGFNAGMKI